MQKIILFGNTLIKLLNASAPWVALLLLRMLVGWEFLEAGLEKYNGENWFAHVKDDFPFPFNSISTDISWFLATWFELIGGIALIAGFGTRLFSVSLMVLTVVATLAVHWPADWNSIAELAKGYAITDKGHGNFKLPLIYMTMLLPLLFMGPGKLSFDHFIYRKFNKNNDSSNNSQGQT